MDESAWRDEEVLADYRELLSLLAREVFPGTPVRVHLCDDDMRTHAVVRARKATHDDPAKASPAAGTAATVAQDADPRSGEKNMVKTRIGTVDVRSGILAMLDFGLLVNLGDDPRAPAAAARNALSRGRHSFKAGAISGVVLPALPSGRHAVHAIEIGEGRYQGMCDHVAVEFQPGAATAKSQELGRVAVDEARIGLFDLDALEHWNNDRPADGLADVVFWGGDEEELARTYQAPRLEDETYGFLNLPVVRAEALATELEALRETGRHRFAVDYRPHNDHYRLLAQMRASPAGTIEVGGANVCGFFSDTGDGHFPVFLDLDAEGRAVRCRIVLGTEEQLEAFRQLNEAMGIDLDEGR